MFHGYMLFFLQTRLGDVLPGGYSNKQYEHGTTGTGMFEQRSLTDIMSQVSLFLFFFNSLFEVEWWTFYIN